MQDSDKPNEGELILYQTPEGTVRIEVLYESETFWLNQKKIAELFGVEFPTISYHLKEFMRLGNCSQEATLRKILRVQTEGKREFPAKSSSTTSTRSFPSAIASTAPRLPNFAFGRPEHCGNSSSRGSSSTTSG